MFLLILLCFTFGGWSPNPYCKDLNQDGCLLDYDCVWCVNTTECVDGYECSTTPPNCPTGAIISDDCSDIEVKVAKILVIIFVVFIDIGCCCFVLYIILIKTNSGSLLRKIILTIGVFSLVTILTTEIIYRDELLMISYLLIIIFMVLLCSIPIVCSIVKKYKERRNYQEVG